MQGSADLFFRVLPITAAQSPHLQAHQKTLPICTSITPILQRGRGAETELLASHKGLYSLSSYIRSPRLKQEGLLL